MARLRALLIRLFCRNKPNKAPELSFLKLEDGTGVIALEGTLEVPYADLLLIELEETLNVDAERTPLNNYVICSRSGFKVRPGELIKDPYSGEMVLPEFADRDYREGTVRSMKPYRSIRPEQDDRFISVAITTDDL